MTDSKLQELGRAILKGLSKITESHDFYLVCLRHSVCGCALGAAYVGIVGDADIAAHQYLDKEESIFGILSDYLQVKRKDLLTISNIHTYGISAQDIADRLIAGETIDQLKALIE